ncbi:DgyrCDS7692 [Dimorphilus gyrociliatus]|uniref:DgyrCDS7692 n=1 Tax=Dimorphilus gyrociliatus TaxID=2664684 RepID=A0A7I8VWS7_9ANNE|nr:DgyrCDS7692 [Dimorphilus gyrociliatus]
MEDSFNSFTTVFKIESYDGSTLLQPIAQLIEFGLDKVNFFACQLLSIVIAYLFRIFCHPKQFSIRNRHIVQLFVGVSLLYFCFGKQISHVWLQLIISYGLLRYIKTGLSEKIVLVWCMGHLSFCHYLRAHYTDGNYNIDISAPLMICVQRLTSLAMNISDGKRNDQGNDVKKLSHKKDIIIKEVPTFLEVASYVFSFHTLLSGPLIFYKDYDNFITGRNLCDKNGSKLKPEPNPNYLFKKWFMLYLFHWSNLMKYELTWKLAESANVAAGLGFQGYKENGEEDWNGADNLSFWEFEISSSINRCVATWNITTNVWLKYVVYERVPFFQKWAVFGFSAIWHGFQVGYYVCAISCMILRSIERRIRKNFIPLMEKFPGSLQIFFRIIGLVAFKLGCAFCGMPFQFLDMELYLKTMKYVQLMIPLFYVLN